MTCSECGGCTDDRCGGCDLRFCGGTYLGKGCDRCPEKVPKEIETTKGPMTVMVRCNSSCGVGHKGSHHWDPWKAGR